MSDHPLFFSKETKRCDRVVVGSGQWCCFTVDQPEPFVVNYAQRSAAHKWPKPQPKAVQATRFQQQCIHSFIHSYLASRRFAARAGRETEGLVWVAYTDRPSGFVTVSSRLGPPVRVDC